MKRVDISALELVSIEGELALVFRLGQRCTDPVPALARAVRKLEPAPPEIDTVGHFLAMETRRVSGARCRAGPLYEAYREWCEKYDHKRLSLQGFHRAMKARGHQQIRSNGHFWRDISMDEEPPEGPF